MLNVYIERLQEYERLFEMDKQHIEMGFYRKPYTADIRHRECNPLFMSGQAMSL